MHRGNLILPPKRRKNTDDLTTAQKEKYMKDNTLTNVTGGSE